MGVIERQSPNSKPIYKILPSPKASWFPLPPYLQLEDVKKKIFLYL